MTRPSEQTRVLFIMLTHIQTQYEQCSRLCDVDGQQRQRQRAQLRPHCNSHAIVNAQICAASSLSLQMVMRVLSMSAIG
jgi:hypothetical protein